MADRPTPPESLPPWVRDELVRLLTEELAIVWDAGITAGGTPEKQADIIDERRCSIEGRRPSREDRAR